MSNALIVPVKESILELKKYLKTCIPFIQPRIRLLLVLKKYDGQPLSKRLLMDMTGLCSYSVHKWRTLYMTGGIEGLLKHNKVGFRPRKFTAKQHELLSQKLHNPENNIRGYKELQEWVIQEFKMEVSYNTLFKYCVKHFGTKIKVARKYHAKKDEEQVTTFKKTLVLSAKKH